MENSYTHTAIKLVIWLKVIKQNPSLLCPLSMPVEFPCVCCRIHKVNMSAKKPKGKPTSTAGWRAEVLEHLQRENVWRVCQSPCRSIKKKISFSPLFVAFFQNSVAWLCQLWLKITKKQNQLRVQKKTADWAGVVTHLGEVSSPLCDIT